MMLIIHIFNMHLNIYIYFPLTFKLSKLVQVGESKWILNVFHFQHDVVLKCTFKFSTFKYYSRIYQNFNGKICLNSI
jgi:hypothetical protein